MVGVVGKVNLLYGIVKMLLNQEKLVLMVYVESARLHITKMATSALSVIKALWIIERYPLFLTYLVIERIGKGWVQ